jgi:hypothetical protein
MKSNEKIIPLYIEYSTKSINYFKKRLKAKELIEKGQFNTVEVKN